MEVFPILSSVVTDGILKKATPYELFSFSTRSEEARNIVKEFSNSQKFHMDIHPNKSCLVFKYDEEESTKLYLYCFTHPANKLMDHILHFQGLNESVPTEIITGEDTTICTYWKKEERDQGLQFLIEYIAKVFNNISISVDFGVIARGKVSRPTNMTKRDIDKMEQEESRLQKTIKAIIKKFNFNVLSYRDPNDVYSFKDLEQLIACESLNVSECKLTKEQLKKLFDKWMNLENPGKITIGTFESFKIADLSAEYAIESSEITKLGTSEYFEMTRPDGIKARIGFWNRRFSFEII